MNAQLKCEQINSISQSVNGEGRKGVSGKERNQRLCDAGYNACHSSMIVRMIDRSIN
jgi:hypothetical protein